MGRAAKYVSPSTIKRNNRRLVAFLHRRIIQLLESQSEVTKPVAENKPQNFPQAVAAVSEVLAFEAPEDLELKAPEDLALDVPEVLALDVPENHEVNDPPKDQALDVLTAGDLLKMMKESMKIAFKPP